MKHFSRQQTTKKRALIFIFVSLFLLVNNIFAADKATENLARSVTIYRDTFGVPHVYGRSDESVVFGLMYVQAEDNFWQLEEDQCQPGESQCNRRALRKSDVFGCFCSGAKCGERR